MIVADIVMMNYELRRAAANDDRMPVVSATVKINTSRSSCSFGAIGRSVDAIRASAEQLAGDEPFGLSVMVRQ